MKSDKLLESTMKSLKGELLKESNKSNWKFKPTKNSSFPIEDARGMGGTAYIRQLFNDSNNYKIYMKALEDLEDCLNKENIFIQDVQIMSKFGFILGLVAICKNKETENLKFDKQIESGIFIQVDRNQNTTYKFAVDTPISIDVECNQYPNKKLIKGIKSYLETF